MIDFITSFETKLSKIATCLLLILPEEASKKLPSRGMVMVQGTLNKHPFQAPLEPDGKGSHWFKVDQALSQAAEISFGDTAKVTLKPIKEWPEPEVPFDLKVALKASENTLNIWEDITPMARWDWIRWIRSTKQAATRARRIKNTCSMLNSGKRRPCCFNRNMCTETAISKNGVLINPS